MEIRIGNDVRLNFTLNNVSFYIENMRSAKAFLINTTMLDAWKKSQEDKQKRSHMRHYEPFPQFYDSTPYTTNACGLPTYNIYPSNCKCWLPKRNLFGWHNKPYKESDKFTFEIPVRILPRLDKIQAYFKAFNQVPGEYKVIMQYTVYEEGYGLDNLHTYTIDYGKLFELVYSETPDPKSIVVDIDSGKVVQDITYGPLMIETFTYGDSDLDSNGGTFIPVLEYRQLKTTTYSDGTEITEYITSGANVQYSAQSELSGAVLLSNGKLTVDKNTEKVRREIGSISVQVTTTDQFGNVVGSASKSIDIYQNGTLDIRLIANPDTLTYYYKKSTQSIIISVKRDGIITKDYPISILSVVPDWISISTTDNFKFDITADINTDTTSRSANIEFGITLYGEEYSIIIPIHQDESKTDFIEIEKEYLWLNENNFYTDVQTVFSNVGWDII